MVYAIDLRVGRPYIYIDRWKSDKPETNMGELLEKGPFRYSGNGNQEPSGTLKFKKGTKVYDWDDTFKVDTFGRGWSGGKRKTRRNRKSRKLKKSKSRKNRKKSNRRR